MKDQRHKRRESFSVLFISNLDGRTRQFQVSLLTLRLLPLLLLVFVAAGWMVGHAFAAPGDTEALQKQLTSQDQLIQQLEAEKEALTQEKQSLIAEMETQTQQESIPAGEDEPAPEEAEPPIPDRYPLEGAGTLTSNTYSEESPYITIRTYKDAHIIAAGNGTVTAVSSDDTYSHIIEIEHEGGYKTRYLCHEDAEVQTEEGAQVQQGDPLLNIMEDDTQLDYQVILDGEPVDPLSVIDAKG